LSATFGALEELHRQQTWVVLTLPKIEAADEEHRRTPWGWIILYIILIALSFANPAFFIGLVITAIRHKIVSDKQHIANNNMIKEFNERLDVYWGQWETTRRLNENALPSQRAFLIEQTDKVLHVQIKRVMDAIDNNGFSLQRLPAALEKFVTLKQQQLAKIS